jgi:hypothetical protein
MAAYWRSGLALLPEMYWHRKISSPSGAEDFPGWARPRTVPVKINTLGITGPQTLVLVYREEAEKEIDAATLNLAADCDVALILWAPTSPPAERNRTVLH